MFSLRNWINCAQQLRRTKVISKLKQEKSELPKVLSVFDLTALGIGCTLGIGVYVLPGIIAKENAGPGVVLSFFVAAFVSVLAGLCFAEFGARVPRAGSAYVYSYVTVGELVAFTIGWVLILEYIIGTASVARGLSTYIDSLIGGQMEQFYRSMFEIQDASLISEYFDLFAFIISLIVTLGFAYGVKESVIVNNCLTAVNIFVVLFTICFGAAYIDFDNWSLPESDVPEGAGTGGFLPFGVLGVFQGAATSFFGYVGFDVICTSGEETENPQKSIPVAIIATLFIIFLVYFGLSAVLTLMWPYYLQDIDAPLPAAFDGVGLHWAAWVIAIGGIAGLLASLFSGFFPLPRIIYSMANDGLIFRSLGSVHSKYGTPFIGTIVSGVFMAFTAAGFNLKQLVDFMSLGTLVVYTIVSCCVLLLRYRYTKDNGDTDESEPLLSERSKVTYKAILGQLINSRATPEPSRLSSFLSAALISIFCVVSIALARLLIDWQIPLSEGDLVSVSVIGILSAALAVILILLSFQPSDVSKLSFKVPLVPLVPALSFISNFYLMMHFDSTTWLRLIIWMALGYIIYFAYGMWHSDERRPVVREEGEEEDQDE